MAVVEGNRGFVGEVKAKWKVWDISSLGEIDPVELRVVTVVWKRESSLLRSIVGQKSW